MRENTALSWQKLYNHQTVSYFYEYGSGQEAVVNKVWLTTRRHKNENTTFHSRLIPARISVVRTYF